ncbi:g7675 [Coccomyxa viridis]|uniref:G7675 protein n=1 Tax=Coccomyxa viridis TaxID=1274662 RepID=A0ABP1G2J4_9CHLO
MSSGGVGASSLSCSISFDKHDEDVFTGKRKKALRGSGHYEECKQEGDDTPRFGTTRSWWLRRQEALLAEMLKGLKDTGDAELMASVDEARKCSRHLKLESVQQDPPLLQFRLDRYRTTCSRLVDATLKEVPGGYALLADMTQCADVLMIPDVSVAPDDDIYLRPEHEVDLLSLTPPSACGDIQRHAGTSETTAGYDAGLGHHLISRNEDTEKPPIWYDVGLGQHCIVQNEDSLTAPLLHASAQSSTDCKKVL